MTKRADHNKDFLLRKNPLRIIKGRAIKEFNPQNMAQHKDTGNKL